MKESNEIILSVLVVSHNQVEFLERCLDSILSQRIIVPWEIIVSDDNSTDGSYEYAKSFIGVINARRVDIKDKGFFVPSFSVYQCNSDDAQPSMVSERCGWNKLNAFEHARGKYFVNVDADDYLRSNDIYQLQIDALEEHMDCSMCMQQSLSVKAGDSVESGYISPQSSLLQDGSIISAEVLIRQKLRGVNPTYMIRRHAEDDMRGLYGKEFDDTVITYHHLQYGSVVFIARADYVWVQYPNSISHSMTDDERVILYGLLPLHHAKMIPSFRQLFLRQGLSDMIHMFKWVSRYPDLSNQYRDYFSTKAGFIYRYFTEDKHSFISFFRFGFTRVLLLVMKKLHLTGSKWLDFAEFCLIA